MLREKVKNYIDREFCALGTLNYIKVFDNSDNNVMDLAVNRVYEIEQRMSAFLPDSDVSRINRNAGNGYIAVSEDTFQLLERGTTYSKLSKGAFEMTVRPLVDLWGIGKKSDYIPEETEIMTTLKLVGYKDLLLNKKKTRVALRHPGQAIDLGGIAKGFAADEVKRILVENNVKNALINLGGNVLTMGQRPDGGLWQIGIQNPLAPSGSYLGVLSLSEKTIVTSGSNERFFIKNGIRYHHILDSKTGKPAQSSLLSVTVVSDCSMDADALTTALFVLGLEDSISLLKKCSAEAVFVTDKLGIYLTEGLINTFTVSKTK